VAQPGGLTLGFALHLVVVVGDYDPPTKAAYNGL